VETGQPPRVQPPEAPARPPGRTARLTERARTSPYYPAVSHPVLRRILPATAASALGDGMSAVAIAWLALRLAPPDSRGLWVGAAVAAFGRLDVLVNNAGLQHVAPIVEFPEERWNYLLSVLLTGTFLCTKYALRHSGTRSCVFSGSPMTGNGISS